MKESDNLPTISATLAYTNLHIHSQNTFNAIKNSTQAEEVLPWNEFIHDSIKAVVQITAW